MSSSLLSPDLIRAIAARATKLLTKEQIGQALDEMAQKINSELHDQNPVVLCVMIGMM